MTTSDFDVLGTMYAKMTTQKSLPEIFTEDIAPLLLVAENTSELATSVAFMWKAIQRGRIYYTAQQLRDFAVFLGGVREPAGAVPYLVLTAARLLLYEGDKDAMQAVLTSYEAIPDHDPGIIQAVKVAHCWLQMNDRAQAGAAEAELKTLLGVL